jgi:hypothetical protein
MSTYKLPCGCVVERTSEHVERVFKQCDCCAAEFNERHTASAGERAEARAALTTPAAE